MHQLDRLPEGTRLLSAIMLAPYYAWSPVEARLPEPMPMTTGTRVIAGLDKS